MITFIVTTISTTILLKKITGGHKKAIDFHN